MGDVLTVLPFGNTVATLGLMGSDVIAALENGVSQWRPSPRRTLPPGWRACATASTRSAQPAIVSCRLNVKNPDGSFSPIDPTAIYQRDHQ